MKSVKELREELRVATEELATFRKDKFGQELSADYRSQWDKQLNVIDLIRTQLENEEKVETLQRSLSEVKERRTETIAETKQDVRSWFANEVRKDNFQIRTALTENNPASGGTFMPNTLMQDVISVAKPLLRLYSSVDVRTGPPGDCTFKILTTNMTDASDVTYGTDATEMVMGTGSLFIAPKPMNANIAVSNIELESTDIYNVVVEQLAAALSQNIETKIATGTTGLMVVSDTLPTSRDSSTGNTTTEWKWANVKDGFYRLLHPDYADTCTFATSTLFFSHLVSAVDGNGQEMSEARELREKGSFNGRPFLRSSKMPATATTGLYCGIAFAKDAYIWKQNGEYKLLKDPYTKGKQSMTTLIFETAGAGGATAGEKIVRFKLA